MTSIHYRDIGEIRTHADVPVLAAQMAPAYVKSRWAWVGIGAPSAIDLKARMFFLLSEARMPGARFADCGGIAIHKRNGKFFLRADKKLQQQL